MKLSKRKKDVVKVEVEENILTLYLCVKAALVQNPRLPDEYLKEGYKFLNKIKEMSGIDNTHPNDDLIEYGYTFNAVYEKNPNIESDN